MTRVTAFLFVVCAVAGVGCGGSEFTAATTDGGADGASGGDAPSDAPPPCITPPPAAGNEADFCQLEAALYSRCGQCEACRQTNVNNCVTLGDALSGAFKGALAACKDHVACGDYATYAGDGCVLAKITATGVTAAQQAAKTAYCQACPANPSECSSFFDITPVDAGADAGTRGIGGYVILSNDTIAQTIASQCTGGINCNPGFYVLCSAGKLCNQLAPDACNKGFCGK